MMRSLVDTPGALSSARGQRGDVRYTLSAEGIRYVTHRDRAQLPDHAGHLEHRPNHRQTGPHTVTWATASRRGRGRRSTPTASPGSSRSFWPRPGPTPTASWNGPCPHRQVRPGLQLGRFRHRPRRRRAPDRTGGLHDAVLLRARASRPPPQGSSCPPETLRPATTIPTSLRDDQPPYPVTLFVVDTEEVEDNLRAHSGPYEL